MLKVSNFDFETKSKEIVDFFKKTTKVNRVNYLKDSYSRFRGIVFIDFKNKEYYE